MLKSKLRIAIFAVACASPFLAPSAAKAQQLINESGVQSVPTAHGMDCPRCYTNDCLGEGQPPRAFGASCATLTVNLPLNAQIVRVTGWTNAAGTEVGDRDYDAPREVSLGQDVGWSIFDNYSVSYAGNIKVVTVRYHNRSCHRPARQVKVTVYYVIP